MLIGSEITCVCFLDILHKVHIGGLSRRQRQFRLKFSLPETTPTSAKASSAQVLRNSPRAMPLTGSNLPHSVVEDGIIHRVFPMTRGISKSSRAPHDFRSLFNVCVDFLHILRYLQIFYVFCLWIWYTISR